MDLWNGMQVVLGAHPHLTILTIFGRILPRDAQRDAYVVKAALQARLAFSLV